MSDPRGIRGWRWRGLAVRATVLALCAMLTGAATTRAAGADTLERRFNKDVAESILQFARKNDYKNIGVLKFLVKKGDAPLSDNVGPLNTALARRLEIALVLADKKDELAVLRNASLVAGRLPGANHRTKAGRAPLFTGSYPVMVGNRKVAPDAFVTGLVEVDADLKMMLVAIKVFGRKDQGASTYTVAGFEIPIDDPNILIETGESFRSAIGGRRRNEGPEKPSEETRTEVTPAQAPAQTPAPAPTAQAALYVRQDPVTRYPLKEKAAPVTLRIYYDQQEIPLEISKDGKARIPEPNTGQRVRFTITNQSPGVVGVVLKVNGINTLFMQKLRDIDCRKWILDPGEQVDVEGFNMGERRLIAFQVKSPEESAVNEVNYSEDVGTISLTVFRDAGKGTPPPPPTASPVELATARGELPDESFEDLDVLRTRLRRQGEQTRGLIEAGREEYGPNLNIVPFKPYPVPEMSATITYYNPRTRGPAR